jgi:hypothetical protein
MAGWNIPYALSLPPFGPDPSFIPGDKTYGPIGEEPRAPVLQTSPAGGGGMKRRLVCRQSHVLDWLIFYSTVQPLDPYCLNGVLWEFSAEPFEKQLRISNSAIEELFPGLAYYELAVLNLSYEATGMRYYPGMGVVKEEQKPRLEQVPAGIQRYMVNQTGTTEGPTLTWRDNDPKGNNFLYYGEHPQCSVGSREIILTFPFAPSGAEPFAEGSVNSDAFTLPVTGDVCTPATLKYMGVAKEASVVIPAVGIFTGLMRYRKSFVFHYLNANLGPVPQESGGGGLLTWNTYWRARDQAVGQMQDMNGDPYLQYTPESYARNWWL